MQLFTRRPEADAEIVRLTKEGKKAREIMQLLNVSCTRVTRVRLEAGLSKARLTAGEKAKVFALHEQGLSHVAIGRLLGVTDKAVGNMIRKGASRAKMPNHIEIRDGVAYVTLSKGYVAKVDVADVPLISDYRWAAQVTEEGKVYAIAQRNGYRVMMHRLIMGNPKNMLVDHRDHDTLDNRRSELIPTTHSGNSMNKRRTRDTGLPRGVQVAKGGGYWGQINLSTGVFDTPADAQEARRLMIELVRGAGVRITEKIMPPREESS